VLKPAGSEYRPVAGCCEHGDEPSRSVSGQSVARGQRGHALFQLLMCGLHSVLQPENITFLGFPNFR
jgi:hypothetical protein